MERVRDSMEKDLLKGLTEEQIAKVKACKNSEELLALAKEEGIELTDEQLEAVSGGSICSTPTFTCPECGSTKVSAYSQTSPVHKLWVCDCKKCGHRWTT